MARKDDDGERRVETDIETERNEREGERRREESSIDAARRDEDDVGQRAGVFGVDDEENQGAASRGVGMRRGPGHGRAGVEGERLQSQPSTRAMRILRESEQAQQEEDKRDAMQTATTTAKSPPPVAPVTKSQASGGRKGKPVVSSSSRSTQATRKDPRMHQRLEPLEYTRPLGGSLERAGMSVYTYNVNTSSLELQGASRDAEGAIGVETVRGFSETQPSVMYGASDRNVIICAHIRLHGRTPIASFPLPLPSIHTHSFVSLTECVFVFERVHATLPLWMEPNGRCTSSLCEPRLTSPYFLIIVCTVYCVQSRALLGEASDESISVGTTLATQMATMQMGHRQQTDGAGDVHTTNHQRMCGKSSRRDRFCFLYRIGTPPSRRSFCTSPRVSWEACAFSSLR